MSLGMVLARSYALTAVSAFLAEGLKQKDHTVRQRLREWGYESQAKRGKKRQAVRVETCLAPLLAWVLSWWTGAQLALALDATTLGDRLAEWPASSAAGVRRGCSGLVIRHLGSRRAVFSPLQDRTRKRPQTHRYR